MRRYSLIPIILVVLLAFPAYHYPVGNTISNEPNHMNPNDGTNQLSEVGSSSGTGPALDVTYSGTATNVYDDTFTMDSSTSATGTVTLSDGWTGDNLQTDIDSLSMNADDQLNNWNLDDYHAEKWLIDPYQSENVYVPNSWTLSKDIGDTSSGSEHPHHGVFEMNSQSGNGYGNTMGWAFDAHWYATDVLNTGDKVYISQLASVPYRELYSAEVSFRYNVQAISSMQDELYIFVNIAGYQTKVHVFESGDAQSTWLQHTVSLSSAQISSIDLPNSVLIDVGIATDLSGSQSSEKEYEVLIDDIQLSMDVRPFPEQIDLKANGTAVVGATKASVYPYLPDDSNRDAEDDPDNGIDLDGYPWGTGSSGILYVSGWGDTGWSDIKTWQAGFQFPLSIPQGAVITDAYMEVEPAYSNGVMSMRIYAAGQNSSGDSIEPFTTGLPHMEDRFNWVDTSIDWEVSKWTSSVRIRQRSPDITALIQSIVSDGSWNQSDYTCLMLDYLWGDSYQTEYGIKGSSGTNDYAQDELARLFVEYMIPLPEDEVYSFSYEKDITIDHTQVAADLTDFPVMVELFDADLKTKVQPDGDDIAFRMGDTPLDFEIELFDQGYSQTEAHLVAWVKVPTLSSTADTTITMMYGNPDARPTSTSDTWDGFEMVQHMNEDPTGTLYDSSSNNYVGTSYGSMTLDDLVTGQIDGATDFDGSNDVVSVGQIDTDDWTQFTTSAWVYYLPGIQDPRVFSKTDTTSSNYHILTTRIDSGTNNLTVRISTDYSGSQNGDSYDTSTTLTEGNWYHIAWSWSAATETILVYVNGNQVYSVSHLGTSIYDSVEVFTIGNNDLTNSRFWNGTIDEVRLTQSVLNENWISTEYNNQLSPSTFLADSTERILRDTWQNEDTATLTFTTSSTDPITMDATMTMEIEGSGQSLDEDMNDGTTFYVANGSNKVDWTANVLVSPPNNTQTMNVEIDYPLTQWRPTTVTNPLGQVKTYGTDWDYDGGTVTIYYTAVDVWGVWVLEFESWNYVEELQLGISGQSLSDSATLNINDDLKLKATTPWIQNARAGLILTDPNGAVWYTNYNTTGAPGTTWDVPSFQYRMPLTVPSSQVDADLTDFPVLVSFADTNLQDSSKVQSDGDDIVFVQNGLVLSHEIERFQQTTGRIVAWVKANLSSTVDTSLHMYYGNPIVGSCESKADVWSSNYEAVWHMDEDVTNEAVGGIHYDSTAGDYQGTQNGNSRTSGIANSFGQAFDGTDDWIVVDSTEGLDPSGDLSLSGWFYLSNSFSSTSATSQMIMEKFKDNDNNFHLALVGTDYSETGVSAGSLAFGFEINNDEFTKWTTKTVWNIGWYHYTAMIDSDTPSNTKIYIDGLDNTDPDTYGAISSINLDYSADWGIGGRYGETAEFGSTPERFLNGEMDEVRVSTAVRASGWISTEYNNQNNPGTFVTRGNEEQKTSPEHTFTKTIDSSAIAGEWTASVYYNDTGTSVSEATGLYERNFIVKHDSSLELLSPTDAVSDKTSLKIAGELLQVEVKLTDDITTDGITGATVKINWTVSGTPTDITLDEYDNGRYGKVLNTSDLAENKRWRIDIWSSHIYYNDATDYFDLDLNHDTDLTYINVETTPTGFDFTATLVFRDVYDDAPISGATITFANGTPVTILDEGSGRYNISLSTSSLSLGDHWYEFVATTSGAYLEDDTTNVTFTLRKHYTSVSVQGDFVTPYGEDTGVSVIITDLDTGNTLSGTSSVSSWTFSWTGDSDTESPPSDFSYVLATNTWAVGTDTVTISVTMTGDYADPTDYQFDVQIRKHYTSVTVIGDLLTPHGFDTTVTIVVIDSDTGSTLSNTGDVSWWDFDWGTDSYNETLPSDFNFTLTTSTWNLGTKQVTLSVAMSGDYYDPANYQFNVDIRKHYTSVSVNGDLVTPYGQTTDITVIITDLDTGTLLGSTNPISYWNFTSTYDPYSESSPSDFAVTLGTDTWNLGIETVTLSVTMSGIYSDPTDYNFNIEIRKHRTAASIIGEFVTPYGETTEVTVVITDLDTGVQLSSTNYVSHWNFTSSNDPINEENPTDFDVTLGTDTWLIGTETVTLSVTMLGAYDSPQNIQFDISIRKHYTSVSVSGDLVTPHGFDTSLTITIRDTDNGSILSSTDYVSSWIFDWSSSSDQEAPPDDFSYILATSSWNVDTFTVTLSVNMSGIYQNPIDHQFEVQVRNHYTSVSVTGGLVTPYGNYTPIEVVIKDLDTDSVISDTSVVTSWSFTSSYDPLTPPTNDFSVNLNTSGWSVGTEAVTLSVTLGGNYFSPSDYVFNLQIRSLETTLYHEPSDLLFPTGDDFVIILRLNVTEQGVYYRDPINGLSQGNFTVKNSTYTYPATITFLNDGRYNLTIDDVGHFVEGRYTITVTVDPTSSLYALSNVEITFDYQPARSDLTANLYTISTPYKTNATVTLTYYDLDRGSGITDATITANISWISYTHVSSGKYDVEIGVASLTLGSHYVNLTADAEGYAAKSVIITVVITRIHTDAEPSTISIDMPVGNTEIFYIDYLDLDNDIAIESATYTDNWNGSIPVNVTWTGSRYEVNLTTTGLDALDIYLLRFNFSNGENYQPAICEIEVDVRTHITIFNLVTAVEPTAFNALINISVRYYDFDNKVGIDSGDVEDYVWNGTHWVVTTLINEGGGYYTIQINATQFPIGEQDFLIYFNWTGTVQQYENKTITTSVNIIGVASELTLISSSEPTPYYGNMSYTIKYAEQDSGDGIANTSNSEYGDGHVFIYVEFDGVVVNLSKVDIWEVDYASKPGQYSIRFNTSIFSSTGLFYMNLYINWSKGVDPQYTNRTDTISVRVLARDTLVSVIPASSTPYNEYAEFSFTYEDTLASEDIENSSQLSISLDLLSYSISYDAPTRTYTVSFNTSQFGSLGEQSFSLNVTWSGIPFYANRTNRVVYVTVTDRDTTLDYQAPSPTSYRENVTFTITWTDIAGASSSGIENASVLLYDGASPISDIYYSVADTGGGVYDVELNTTYKTEPGFYTLRVELSATEFYYFTVTSDRTFEIRRRITILTSDPVDDVPYNSPIEVVLYYQDLLSLGIIGNDSSQVSFEIVTAGDWTFTITWRPSRGNYLLSVETSDQTGLEIGIEYQLQFNMSYAHADPYYRWDDLTVSYQLRYRASSLEQIEAPIQTPYLDYSNFTVYYSDADAGTGIDGGSIHIMKGGSSLNSGSDFIYSTGVGGYYYVSVNSTALDGLGGTQITVWANWTTGTPYHDNVSLSLTLTVTRRSTNVAVLVPPSRTNYLENVVFVVAFNDLGTNIALSTDKSLVTVYNEGVALAPADFTFTQLGSNYNYEISINSTILSSELASELNITVFVDWPDSPNYYQDDSTSIRVTIIERDTALSIDKPQRTAYGENATLSFQFLDTTKIPEQIIENEPSFSLVTNLTETPSISYDSASGTYTISFDTAQFGDVGVKYFYINVTWAGSPFYENQTLQVSSVNILYRETQANFEAPVPTPYNDNVIFNVTYLDIAGDTEFGISNGNLTLYYLGSPIPSENYNVTPDGSGVFNVELYTGFFTEPGSYELNASLLYTGTEFKENASAIRSLLVRFRGAILSADPVGSIGYGTQMEVILEYQDQLTLDAIGNSSSETTLTILNDTGTPWVFTIQWQPSTETYRLLIDTDGQELNVSVSYSLRVNMTFAYQSPYYRHDDTYIFFSIRKRISLLTTPEPPTPTAFNEFAEFEMYYEDVDENQGISGATILIGSLVENTDFFVTEGSPGIYFISLNTSSIGAPNVYVINVTADWLDSSAPYHNDASRNVTLTVTQRSTEVEILSPPGQARFLDNITFTFAFTDTAGSVDSRISISQNDIDIWANGTLVDVSNFTLTTLAGDAFRISINTTVLATTLVSDYNLTLVVAWSGGTPYYEDDQTEVSVSSVERSMSVTLGQIETTPIGDNMTISFTLIDSARKNPVSGSIILFECQTVTLVEGFTYWVSEGVGPLAGHYNVTVWTEALIDVGNYNFDLDIHWNPSSSPYYNNLSTITVTGTVDLIWTSAQNDIPSPSSVEISGYVQITAYYRDLDHNQIGIDATPPIVTYLSTGIVPSDLTINNTAPGVYNITFSTIDLDETGIYTLNITFKKTRYEAREINPSITVSVISTVLAPDQDTIQLYWTELANITVSYEDLLHANLTTNATVTYSWAGGTGSFTESATPGEYIVNLDTFLADSGTQVVTITAEREKFRTSITTVTLIVLTLPSEMIAYEPVELVNEIPRGSPVDILIYLNDTRNIQPVPDSVVTTIYASFQGTDYPLAYNGTAGFYTTTIPGTDTQIEISFYDIRVTAQMNNYDPASFSFKIDLLQTLTTLALYGDTKETLEAVYFEQVEFSVRFTESVSGDSINNGSMVWTLSEAGLIGNFTNTGNGVWTATFDTAQAGYGTWGFTFRGIPGSPVLSANTTTLTLTIKRIPTQALNPSPLTVVWGWTGNISFFYHDTYFDAGINGSAAQYSWGTVKGDAIDLGNGTYLVPIDSTKLTTGDRHSVQISFTKENYQESNGGIQISVVEIPTELVLSVAEHNKIDSNTNLQVPINDNLVIELFYNDTDNTEGYMGGIENAILLPESSFVGDSFAGKRSFTLESLGDGWYRIVFDTADSSIYELKEWTPGMQYNYYIALQLRNRSLVEASIDITVIEIPAVLEFENLAADNPVVQVEYGATIQISVYYNDTWIPHGFPGVTGATVVGLPGEAAFEEVGTDEIGNGYYTIYLTASAPLVPVGISENFVIVTINANKSTYSDGELELRVNIIPSETQQTMSNAISLGTPISVLLLILVILWVRVFSVPKRLRQVNGQIKALSKGKMPKPVEEAKNRQELVADLFNDTYEKVEITRQPDQLPAEAVDVEVPEMGELLVQLSILTNLSPEELDEFKADISKMKLSEQAAFVKEVIHQEAIRAARRDETTVEEVIEKVQDDARRKIGGEEVERMPVDEDVELDRILTDEDEIEEVPDIGEEVSEDIPEDMREAEEVLPDDRLSPFELEELKKDLEKKGVPAHEIDTIISQAKNLPRDLVDELVRSLGDEE